MKNIKEAVIISLYSGIGAISLRKKLSNLNELDVGKHNNISDKEFDKKELQKGISIEKEHSSNKEIQKAIAKDHLTEFPKYYEELPKMEEKLDKKNKKGDV